MEVSENRGTLIEFMSLGHQGVGSEGLIKGQRFVEGLARLAPSDRKGFGLQVRAWEMTLGAL